MSRTPFPKISPTTLLLLTLAASAVGTMADEAPPQEAQAEEAVLAEQIVTTRDPTIETVQPGLWAFLDPETGELLDQPTPSQSLWLDTVGLPSLNKSSDGLEAFALQGSGRGVNLSGRFRSALTVRRMPDGSLEMRCVDHPDQPSDHDHSPASSLAETALVETAAVK